QGVDHGVYGPDEHVGVVTQHVERHPRLDSSAFIGGRDAIGYHHEVRRALDVEVTDSGACGGPDVLEAALGLLLRREAVVVADREWHCIDADDVGFACGVGQHARSPTADHDWWMW